MALYLPFQRFSRSRHARLLKAPPSRQPQAEYRRCRHGLHARQGDTVSRRRARQLGQVALGLFSTLFARVAAWRLPTPSQPSFHGFTTPFRHIYHAAATISFSHCRHAIEHATPRHADEIDIAAIEYDAPVAYAPPRIRALTIERPFCHSSYDDYAPPRIFTPFVSRSRLPFFHERCRRATSRREHLPLRHAMSRAVSPRRVYAS